MAENKNKITPENSAEWLASCGFIFPRNSKELARFDLLYGCVDPALAVEAVDPFRIIRHVAETEKKTSVVPLPKRRSERLVAGRLKPLPSHILQKLGKSKPGTADSSGLLNP